MIPIRSAVPSRYPAVITWTLIAINCAVFLFREGVAWSAPVGSFVTGFVLGPLLAWSEQHYRVY